MFVLRAVGSTERSRGRGWAAAVVQRLQTSRTQRAISEDEPVRCAASSCLVCTSLLLRLRFARDFMYTSDAETLLVPLCKRLVLEITRKGTTSRSVRERRAIS